MKLGDALAAVRMRPGTSGNIQVTVDDKTYDLSSELAGLPVVSIGDSLSPNIKGTYSIGLTVSPVDTMHDADDTNLNNVEDIYLYITYRAEKLP